MRRLFVALLTTSALSFAAQAADMPVKAPVKAAPIQMYNWTGFYLGINGGGGWAHGRHTDDVTALTTDNFNLSGGLIGGTAGYNWQMSNVVVGIEADYDWAGIQGSSTVNCPAGCSVKITSLGTVRPRLGMTFGQFMPYITGGLAWGTVKAGQPGFETNKGRAGWTVGAGLEAFVVPNWSVKLEYLYAQLQDTSYTVVNSVTVRERDISILRAGVNYHF